MRVDNKNNMDESKNLIFSKNRTLECCVYLVDLYQLKMTNVRSPQIFAKRENTRKGRDVFALRKLEYQIESFTTKV